MPKPELLFEPFAYDFVTIVAEAKRKVLIALGSFSSTATAEIYFI